LRDAIELEWQGVPSVTVVAEPLCGSADAMKKLSGMPDYRYAVVPYPVGSLTSDEIRLRAKQVVPRILALLTQEGDTEDTREVDDE
jgi:hypothetical protein